MTFTNEGKAKTLRNQYKQTSTPKGVNKIHETKGLIRKNKRVIRRSATFVKIKDLITELKLHSRNLTMTKLNSVKGRLLKKMTQLMTCLSTFQKRENCHCSNSSMTAGNKEEFPYLRLVNQNIAQNNIDLSAYLV